jgi:hypothetical protein
MGSTVDQASQIPDVPGYTWNPNPALNYSNENGEDRPLGTWTKDPNFDFSTLTKGNVDKYGRVNTSPRDDLTEGEKKAYALNYGEGAGTGLNLNDPQLGANPNGMFGFHENYGNQAYFNMSPEQEMAARAERARYVASTRPSGFESGMSDFMTDKGYMLPLAMIGAGAATGAFGAAGAATGAGTGAAETAGAAGGSFIPAAGSGASFGIAPGASYGVAGLGAGAGASTLASSFTPEMLAAANASSDPIGMLSYLSGATPAEVTAATGAGASNSLLSSLGSGINSLGSKLGGSLLPSAILGGANVLGSMYGANAAKNASQAQIDASKQANDLAYSIYQQNRADQMPFMQAGQGALKQLVAGTQPGGEFAKDFSYAPFDYNANTDPGTQFRIQQGLDAMNATAAARGGLISGNALKAGQDYGQAQGSQEYGNAFNRYLQNYGNAQGTFQLNRNNRLNPLQSLAGISQSATNTVGNMATNYGNTAGGNITGAGNASAAGTVGSANAVMGGVSGLSNLYSQNSLLNAIQNQNQNRSAYTA